MYIDEDCITCIINQSVKVANAIDASPILAKELKTDVEQMSRSFSRTQTPPQIAADVYEKMAFIANKEDLYDEVKKLSTEKANSFLPQLRKELLNTQDKLLTATKIAVAGNVIDLAAAVEFDLSEELDKIFHTDFAHNDIQNLDKDLQQAKTVVVLGDNVGEHIFDYMFIETLQDLYPNVAFYYFVRGKPIINDVTMKEAKEANFDNLCFLIDSGVNTPGFDYTRATKEAQNIFDSADVILSKGMGNYESLSPAHRKNIYFLLKVKCLVVANALGLQLGDIVCKRD